MRIDEDDTTPLSLCQVRGAPAIAIVAALALAVEASTNSKRPEWIEARPEAIEDIGALRALVRGKLDYLGCNSTGDI